MGGKGREKEDSHHRAGGEGGGACAVRDEMSAQMRSSNHGRGARSGGPYRALHGTPVCQLCTPPVPFDEVPREQHYAPTQRADTGGGAERVQLLHGGEGQTEEQMNGIAPRAASSAAVAREDSCSEDE